MSRLLLVAMSCSVVAAAAGCADGGGGESAPGKVITVGNDVYDSTLTHTTFMGSCDDGTGINDCFEMWGWSWANENDFAAAQAWCEEGVPGAFSVEPCPTEEALGQCNLKRFVYNRYSFEVRATAYPPVTEEEAREMCGEEWTPR